MTTERILSVTLADCDVEHFRSGGKGGQNQNKRDTGTRIRHRASGAVGEARDERSQLQNKKAAFRRMAESPKFQAWLGRGPAGHSELEGNMTKVLGIDSSLTSTGLCIVDIHARPPSMPFRADDEPVLWSAELRTITSKPRKPVTWPNTSARIGEIVLSLAHAMAHVDLVVLEGRSYASPGHALELDWLWGRIVDEVLQQGRGLLVATPSQRSKYATSKGNAKKDIVLAAAIHRFPTVPIEGNDTADATILAAIGCRHLGLPIDTMPKAHWELIMPKLAELT